jgi:hypothetical protein
MNLPQPSSAFLQTPTSPSSEKRKLLAETLIERQRRFNRTRLFRYMPYPKQAEFHAAGATHRERLFMAGNKFGKTECGAAEMAMHLTGLYPDWWVGKRFDKAVRAWAAGVTNESTRDVVQEKLVGPPAQHEEWGTGFIPGDLMEKPPLARVRARHYKSQLPARALEQSGMRV